MEELKYVRGQIKSLEDLQQEQRPAKGVIYANVHGETETG
ncbi:MAG: hypothetical protein CM15mV124_220 [uncultured marine virus]|nr:MAG: hypothetical protein CM15mV124_220 [uncultured marine virus]